MVNWLSIEMIHKSPLLGSPQALHQPTQKHQDQIFDELKEEAVSGPFGFVLSIVRKLSVLSPASLVGIRASHALAPVFVCLHLALVHWSR